jgi:hypothetical protein
MKTMLLCVLWLWALSPAAQHPAAAPAPAQPAGSGD